MTDADEPATGRRGPLAWARGRGAALLLLAVALWPGIVLALLGRWTPEPFFATYDAPKRLVLVVGAGLLLLLDRRPWTAVEGRLRDPLLGLPVLFGLVVLAAGLVEGPAGDLLGPVTFLAAVAAARSMAERDRDAVGTLARASSLALLVAGAVAVQQVAGLDVSLVGERRIAVSLFGNPGFAAQFVAAALPFAALLALRPSRRFDRALGAGALLLGFVHLVLARSRIDSLAAAAGLGLAAVVLSHGLGRRRLARGLVVAGGGAALVVGGLFLAAAFGAGPEWLGRSDTLAVRRHVWAGSWDAFLDMPWRLTGRRFVDLYPLHRPPQEYALSLGRVVSTPHQELLQLAVVGGVWGLAGLAVWSVALVRRFLRALPTAPTDVAALAGCCGAVAVSGLASSPLSHPTTLLLPALAVGALVSLAPTEARLRLPARGVSWAGGVALLAAGWLGPVFADVRSDAYLGVGRRELAAGDSQAALLWFSEAAATDDRSFEAHYEYGTLLRSADEPEEEGPYDPWTEGRRHLRHAVAIRPGSMEARTNLVNALRAGAQPGDERFGEAVALADESLALCDWHPLLLTARAALHMDADEASAAYPLMQRAVASLPPADVRPAELRLVQARRDQVALTVGEDGARETALATVVELLDREQTREAQSAVRGTLHGAPDLLPAIVALAQRLVAERPDDAALLVAAAHSAGRWDEGFYDQASAILYTAGRDDGGRILNGLAWEQRARRALADADLQQALRSARKAAQRAPSTEREVLLARVHAALGNRRQVVEVLGRALTLGTFDADALRQDEHIGSLLPDEGVEEVLRRASLRE